MKSDVRRKHLCTSLYFLCCWEARRTTPQVSAMVMFSRRRPECPVWIVFSMGEGVASTGMAGRKSFSLQIHGVTPRMVAGVHPQSREIS